MKLYEIAAQYAALADAGDLTPEEQAAALSALDGELAAKVEACVAVTMNLNAEIDALEAACKRLTDRKKARVLTVDRIRGYVRTVMDLALVPKIKTPFATVSVRDGNEHVVVVDEAAIPETFVREELVRTVDKAGILKAYREDGECVPGTKIERGERVLTVR